MECPVCRENTESDPQTGRCLRCGRLPADSRWEDDRRRENIVRGIPVSPSANYRQAHVSGIYPLVTTAIAEPVVVAAPVITTLAGPDVTMLATGQAEDDLDIGLRSEYAPPTFDTPTDKFFCPCGAIIVWFVGTPPPACAFCPRDAAHV